MKSLVQSKHREGNQLVTRELGTLTHLGIWQLWNKHKAHTAWAEFTSLVPGLRKGCLSWMPSVFPKQLYALDNFNLRYSIGWDVQSGKWGASFLSEKHKSMNQFCLTLQCRDFFKHCSLCSLLGRRGWALVEIFLSMGHISRFGDALFGVLVYQEYAVKGLLYKLWINFQSFSKKFFTKSKVINKADLYIPWSGFIVVTVTISKWTFDVYLKE